MTIEIKDKDNLQKITDSMVIKVTGDENDVYFNKQDMITILSNISEELDDEKQRDGFLLAVHFILKMGE